MIHALKAEFRKLLSVRSTYYIVIITLAIVLLVTGWGNGVKADAGTLHNPHFLASEATNAVFIGGIILAVVGLLIVGHEYRYNTILYTLTSSNNRAKSLLAKFIAVTVFALVTTAAVLFFAPLCTMVGIHLADKHLVAQTFPIWTMLRDNLFIGWGYMMYALIIAAIIRSQVGSIVTFLLIPLVGEHIVEAIFKSSMNYMPFNSLQAVANNLLPSADNSVSTTHNVVVTCMYVAVGALVSFILFARRDAN